MHVFFIRYVVGLKFPGRVFRKTAEAKMSNGTIVIRAPEMLIGGKDDVVINLRNRESRLKEAGFRCHSYDLAPLLLDKELHITQVKPIVTKSGSTDIVHHMDLFACRSKVDRDISTNIQEYLNALQLPKLFDLVPYHRQASRQNNYCDRHTPHE